MYSEQILNSFYSILKILLNCVSLLVPRSTSEKVSYHFIHANRSVLFENNITLGLFVKVSFHYLLSLIAEHKCSSFHLNFTFKKCTIIDLIELLTPHVNLLRERCTECQLLSSSITVAEVAHLLVFNSQNQFTLAIDLSVYSRNQQFRLFDCVRKRQKQSIPPVRLFGI